MWMGIIKVFRNVTDVIFVSGEGCQENTSELFEESDPEPETRDSEELTLCLEEEREFDLDPDKPRKIRRSGTTLILISI